MNSSRRIALPLLLFGIAMILGAIYLLAGLPLNSARESWRHGQKYTAIRTLERWRLLHLRRADYDTLLAVVYLSAGKRDEAAPHLRALASASKSWFPVVRKSEVATGLISAGRYQEFLEYDTAVRERRETPDLPLYRAAAQLGLMRIQEAETTFGTIDEEKVDARRYAALRSALEQRKKGSYPYILGSGSSTLGVINPANGDLVPLDVDFAALIDRQGGAHSFEAHLDELGRANAIESTLDPAVQRAAIMALSPYRGSLVAIDTRTNEILAVANSAGEGAPANLAFDKHYEPGSIVKVITGLAAANGGAELSKLFPMNCEGFLVLDGRQFFDWAKHGAVPDLDDALASSCNVAFGTIGLQLGVGKLRETMTAVGFGGAVDLGYDRIPLGRIVGNPMTTYQVANLAIGLQHETVNALHVAMLASMIANRGVLTTPRIVRKRMTILGDAIGEGSPQPRKRVASEAAAQAMASAMAAVVTSARGTGRRAALDGVPIAMKTGTAGDSAGGYDALIMAYAPAGSPRIAIGMIAEAAGPAEFAGAKIAHDFFAQVAAKLR